jgi:hypothetical protein
MHFWVSGGSTRKRTEAFLPYELSVKKPKDLARTYNGNHNNEAGSGKHKVPAYRTILVRVHHTLLYVMSLPPTTDTIARLTTDTVLTTVSCRERSLFHTTTVSNMAFGRSILVRCDVFILFLQYLYSSVTSRDRQSMAVTMQGQQPEIT